MIKPYPRSRHLGCDSVSSCGQTRQQLSAKRCAKIHREKTGGAKTDGRALSRRLTRQNVGDVVAVTRLDRFAYSTFDLSEIVKQSLEASRQFRLPSDPCADTAINTGRLAIAELGELTNVGRQLAYTRTREARPSATTQRSHIGRPSAYTPQHPAKPWRSRGEGSASDEIVCSDNIGKAAISWLKVYSCAVHNV